MATKQAKAKKRHRCKAADRYAVELWRFQGGRCFWCPRDVGLYRILAPQGWTLRGHWLRSPDGQRVMLGTLDHVVALKDGGDGNKENLVIACAECNLKRNQQKRTSRLTCKRCGKSTPGKYRHCVGCREYFRMLHVLAWAGWDFWPDSYWGHWQDPLTGFLHTMRWAYKIQGQHNEGQQTRRAQDSHQELQAHEALSNGDGCETGTG